MSIVTPDVTADQTELKLFRQYVTEAAGKFSALSVSPAAKKVLMRTGLCTYATGLRVIAVGVSDGMIDYVSVEHPRLGFVEAHIKWVR